MRQVQQNDNGHAAKRNGKPNGTMPPLVFNDLPPMRKAKPAKTKIETPEPEVIELPTKAKKAKKAPEPEVVELPTKTKGKAKAAPDVDRANITVQPLEKGRITFTVEGISSLIVHRFGEKSRKQMEDNQQGVARHKRAPKVPHEEFLSSLYVIDEKKQIYGFPASGFKKAMVSACRYAEGITMTRALGSFHVMGDILQIKGSKPEMRTDVVRVGKFASKTSDIRYRPEFKNWSIDVEILYNKRVVSKEVLAHLLHLAGFHVGIGEWRPEKGGQFGMFELSA